MDDKTEFTVKTEGLGDEIVKVIHASKSYVSSAFLTLLLYYVGFYIIGLICNIVFLSKSNESKRIAGASPSGRGCLVFLLWVHIILPIIIIIVMFGGALASGGF
ncbi:hypothetical protein [Pontiella sulfatireligans]|uniref:Uncharacterized protein n=1 Tax=Pontiella sulfatireligans TaxID=2750658 RepID=A0A6C2US80_9BACT|nr:hypothetical protein [Pontiella sulfatireligans]VGO23192.1 hypothetical protein SCARR_05298 [Pontiella sulfatireligans]